MDRDFFPTCHPAISYTMAKKSSLCLFNFHRHSSCILCAFSTSAEWEYLQSISMPFSAECWTFNLTAHFFIPKFLFLPRSQKSPKCSIDNKKRENSLQSSCAVQRQCVYVFIVVCLIWKIFSHFKNQQRIFIAKWGDRDLQCYLCTHSILSGRRSEISFFGVAHTRHIILKPPHFRVIWFPLSTTLQKL